MPRHSNSESPRPQSPSVSQEMSPVEPVRSRRHKSKSDLSQTRALDNIRVSAPKIEHPSYGPTSPSVDPQLLPRRMKRAKHDGTASLASPTTSIRSGMNDLTLDGAKKVIERLSSPNVLKRSHAASQVEPPVPGDQSHISLRPSVQPQLTNQQLLLKEVAGLYRAVCLAEESCLQYDAKFRNLRGDDGQLVQLEDNQWKDLLTLHKTLFSEINDFLLASQHPQASADLKQRARQLNIPARLWRVAIHSLLEILRHRLPASQEFLLSFMYSVYSHMTLLLETVPLFKDTWIECLGDLSRFRMAVEETNFKDREIWCGVSRYWYNISADRNPQVGRLQHHLAILARPNLLAQLHYYAKSLTVAEPFVNTRDSIRTLFDPVIQGTVFQHPYFQPSDIQFIKLHGFLFLQSNMSGFENQIKKFLKSFEESLDVLGLRNQERGPFFVISNVATLLGYGSPDSLISADFPKANTDIQHLSVKQASLKQPDEIIPEKMELDKVEPGPNTLSSLIFARNEDGVRQLIADGADVNVEDGVYGRPLSAAAASGSTKILRLLLNAGARVDTNGVNGSPLQYPISSYSPAIRQILETEEAVDDLFRFKRILHSRMLSLVLRRKDDSLLSFIHTSLVFIHAITFHPEKLKFLEDSIPWRDLVAYLEYVRNANPQAASILQVSEFPGKLRGARPLPEDYTLRGLTWTAHYFPPRFHEDANLELDERNLELDSQKEERYKRILWLGKEIATRSSCIVQDSSLFFRVGPQVL